MKLQLAVLAALAMMPMVPAQAQTNADQPPAGDYWRSCRNINLDGYGANITLSAQCRDEHGRTRDTALAFAECGGAVSNRDGQLVCQRGGYSSPTRRYPGNGGYSGGGTQAGGYYSGGRGGPSGWNQGTITLFQGANFQGQRYTSNREVSNLPRQYNDMALSVHVEGGVWEVCADSDFAGRCEVIDRDVPNLNDLGFGEAISSMRPVR